MMDHLLWMVDGVLGHTRSVLTLVVEACNPKKEHVQIQREFISFIIYVLIF
jgi:hypothetical protein